MLENYELPALACALNEVLLKLAGEEQSTLPTLIVPFVVPETKLKLKNRYSGKSEKVSLYGMKLGPTTDVSELLSSRLQQSPLFSQILHEELALLLHLVNVMKLPTVVMIGVTSSKNTNEDLEVTCQIGEHLASVSSLTFSKEKMVQSPTKASRDGKEAWRALYG